VSENPDARVLPDETVRARAGNQRFPDFFIVGHPKSGTTAMWTMLKQHPEIFMPDRKEPSFFVPEIRNHPDDLDTYLSLFREAAPEQRIGEASPAYLWSHTAAGRIAQARPDARIIAIFREPAAFLRSLHLEFLRIHAETEKSFRKAMELDSRRAEGKSIPRNSTRRLFLPYAEHVKYVEQLKRFRAVFPEEQILVLVYEEFLADNAGTLKKILRFLDVDDSIEVPVVEANPSYEVRSPRVSSLVRSLSLGRGPLARVGKLGIEAVTPRSVRAKAMAAQRRAQLAQPKPADEQLMLELRERFRVEVMEMSDYVGRDLATVWGYDGSDEADQRSSDREVAGG
jgi:hypothetical protein